MLTELDNWLVFTPQLQSVRVVDIFIPLDQFLHQILCRLSFITWAFPTIYLKVPSLSYMYVCILSMGSWSSCDPTKKTNDEPRCWSDFGSVVDLFVCPKGCSHITGVATSGGPTPSSKIPLMSNTQLLINCRTFRPEGLCQLLTSDKDSQVETSCSWLINSCVLLISEFRYQHQCNYEPLQHHRPTPI